MARNASAAVALGLFLAGCKAPPPPIVEAEGVVFLDGKPLNNVEVRFFPVSDYGPEYAAKGTTDKQGRFQLTCKGEPGACAGENRVIIVEPDLPAHLRSEKAQAALARHFQSLGGRPLPAKYANLADSPLVANVTADKKVYKFELTR